MPPRIQYTKEQIVEAAIAVIRENGPDAFNARAVAQRLGCSTQPLFREFETMEALKGAVLRHANAIYNDYVAKAAARAEKPYKAAGTAYIRFAEEERELFKLLFMRDRKDESTENEDENIDSYLQMLTETLGIKRETAYDFHIRMWIYTHGMAVMTATGYLHFTDEQVSELLSEEFIALKERFRNENGKHH